ncbi:MAG: response regulator transcription factor [Tissierellales bacterium]|jgi:DNA-binding response OmpR family regulator|nr:response regulator transcription factor [Tissierellales bacterium]
MNKILILEDEASIRAFVKINLARNGFEVVEADTGEKALELYKKHKDIDLAILDVMLPGIDGLEVCKELRNSNDNMGIIMLTARSQELDKVMALDLGADDYLTKPFSPMELVARVNALLRRVEKKSEENDHLVSGVFEIDLNARKFYKSKIEIELTPTEFSLMKMFMKNPDRALTRDELLDEVWGENYIGDVKIVDVNIRRLRKKVEEDSSSPKYIETIWGSGYRWRKEE